MTTTTSKNVSLETLLGRLASDRKNWEYIGVCLVCGSEGWTRAGPTWIRQNGNYLVVGPGVAVWGTERGLAQLAITKAKPSWHEVAASIAPIPNIVMLCVAESSVLDNADVQRLAKEAEL